MKSKFTLCKVDYLCMMGLILLFLVAAIILTYPNTLYGSKLDWIYQHTVFPDYLRQTFYNTGDFLPDFAMNIGGGQNIYNIAYYGLHNPLIMISYALPMVKMTTYISFLGICCAIAASILMYVFLRKKDVTIKVAFVLAIIFLFSTGMMFHSHRHIMFMIYMPFLILALFGVDKKIDENRNFLLAISVFLIILTSFYFSISALVVIVVYGIFKYIENNHGFSLRKFMYDGVAFLVPIFTGIFMASFLLIPTFYVIVTNRLNVSTDSSLTSTLIPQLNFKFVLFGYYGIGLGVIGIIAIVFLVLSKREKRFLGIVLGSIVVFPVVAYVLNGFMYVDGKIFIPFLPLMIIGIWKFLDFLQMRLKKGFPFLLVLLVISSIAIGIKASAHDDFVPIETLELVDEYAKLVEKITDSDGGFYRIGTNFDTMFGINHIVNSNHNISSIYTSTTNKEYHNSYFGIFENNQMTRSSNIITQSENPLFATFSGNKYLINDIVKDEDFDRVGYEKVLEDENLEVYENKNAMPIVYGSSNVFSKEYFDSLSYPYNNELLLDGVVVENPNNGVEKVKENFYFANVETEDLLSEFDSGDGEYLIDGKEVGEYVYTLPEELKNKLLIITFDNLTNDVTPNSDMIIGINGQRNKITTESWKYHNGNYKFSYVFADNNLEELAFTFSTGKHLIKSVKVFVGNTEYLMGINDKINNANINGAKGDLISGTIDMDKDGYLVTSIPYDNGFRLYVDGKEVPVEKVNGSYIGAKLNKGEHDFILEFKAPYKKLGVNMSILGFVLLAGICLRTFTHHLAFLRNKSAI